MTPPTLCLCLLLYAEPFSELPPRHTSHYDLRQIAFVYHISSLRLSLITLPPSFTNIRLRLPLTPRRCRVSDGHYVAIKTYAIVAADFRRRFFAAAFAISSDAAAAAEMRRCFERRIRHHAYAYFDAAYALSASLLYDAAAFHASRYAAIEITIHATSFSTLLADMPFHAMP